jgi:hypothetical protein
MGPVRSLAMVLLAVGPAADPKIGNATCVAPAGCPTAIAP